MKKVWLILSVGLMAMMLSASAFAGASSAIFAFTPGLGTPGTLMLDSTSVTANFTGWYDDTGSHGAGNPNYIAGVCGSSDACNGGDENQHNFFVFAIPSGTYSSAVLWIYNPGVGVGNPRTASSVPVAA